MFIHAFYYYIKTTLRQKEIIFWMLLFPIALATLFHFAFSGLAEDESMKAIPVAVVMEEENTYFTETLKNLSQAGEDQFLQVTYATKDEAYELLEKKEIYGILYSETPARLQVSADMKGIRLEQSMLSTFVDQYNAVFSGIMEVEQNNPENMGRVIEAISDSVSCTTERTYIDGTMDETVSYFFNLIAMVCLYAAMSGMQIAVHNQGNLSSLGARRCLSPMNRSISIFGELCGCYLTQWVMALISVCYMAFILKIDFGSQFGYVLFASLIGCITGTSLGFMIGSIGQMSENIKLGVLIVIVMFFSFLSGLMVQNMRINVEKVCPWLNKINPAALISDSFSALAIFQSHDRYFMNLIILTVMSCCFSMIGFFMVRREKYATL